MKIFWFLHGNANANANAYNTGVGDDLRGSRLVLGATFICFAVFFTWAYFATLDEITRAPGTVISSSRTQVIQSQDGGTLEALLVKEGDTVEAGQLLARLERTRAQATFLETRAKAAGLSATSARLRAEVFGGQPQFAAETANYPDFRANQLALFAKRQDALSEELRAIAEMASLVSQELNMNLPLVKLGDVSRTEVLRLQRQVADLQSQATNKRNKYFQDAQAELNKVEEERAGTLQMMAQRKNLLDQTELISPMRGVVKNVRITTQGGVIRAGEEVMQIVPLEDDLLIEAKVSPTDIAFLGLNLNASVKIDAYDSTIYGELPGKLVFISADTLSENLQQNEKPYYRARVRTTGRQFSGRPNAHIDILPGMTATIEIKTGSKTVLQYLTKPIFKTLNESLGER
jgi:adhesin transport system membrane fusion protein